MIVVKQCSNALHIYPQFSFHSLMVLIQPKDVKLSTNPHPDLRPKDIVSRMPSHRNQFYNHPGSLARLKSEENYILFVLKRACNLTPPVKRQRKRQKTGNDPCLLWILGMGGDDLFDAEVASRVRGHYECRSEQHVREFYHGCRGVVDLPPCLTWSFRVFSARCLAAFDGDDRALMVLRRYHDTDHDAEPLMAAWNNQERCLSVLKEQGADLGKPMHLRPFNYDGVRLTPALVAAAKGYGGCLLLLKGAGCDIEQTNGIGDTPVMLAALNGHVDCLRILKEAGCDFGKAAYVAVENGSEDCLRMMQETGCDLEEEESSFDNFTPVHYAAHLGQEGCLRILKEAGCDLGKVVNDLTPAHVAAGSGHEACLRILKEAGCDLGNVDNDLTPAHMAASFGKEGCLRILQEAGCDLDKLSVTGGVTPAHMAAAGGHADCLRVLREAGCDLGRKNDMDRTPAHLAAFFGHESTLRMLQESGCDLEQVDRYGRTPAHIAYMAGKEACLRVLTGRTPARASALAARAALRGAK